MINLLEINRKHIVNISRWSFFLSLFGFTYTIANIISVIFFWGKADHMVIQAGLEISDFLLMFSMLGAIICFFPSYYLMNFHINLKRVYLDENHEDIESALFYLRSAFRFFGIIAIIFVCLVLLFVFGILSLTFLL
jgi:hypothetical protein